MKIAIFGSSATPTEIGDGITDKRAVEDFCVSLGSVIAEFPHVLLVESDVSDTADRLVVNGLLASPQNPKAKVCVYHRTQRRAEPPFFVEASESEDIFLFKPIPEIRVSLFAGRLSNRVNGAAGSFGY